MSIKVVGGNIPPRTNIGTTSGHVFIHVPVPGKWFKTDTRDVTTDIIAVEQVTDENKNSVLGKAGWGTLGAVALGPVGMLAGLLLGGKSKEICFACKLSTGESFLVSGSVSDFQTFAGAYQANLASGVAELNTTEAEADVTIAKLDSGLDVVSSMKKIGELRDANLITPEEFDMKKKELMARI